MGKLSATAVKAATRPGRLGDGDGLFLIVQPSGSKSWMVRVQKNGNRRDFGLGSASKVSLAKARERAREARAQMEMGLDPLFERRKAQGIPTFREAAFGRNPVRLISAALKFAMAVQDRPALSSPNALSCEPGTDWNAIEARFQALITITM